MKSTKLSSVDQLELPIGRSAKPHPVDVSAILKQPNLLRAISLCIQLSGLDEKEIYMALGIDKGHWTRIMQGEGHFPPNKIDPLMDLCGNEVPLIWQNYKRGYEMRPLKSTLEQQLDAANTEIAQLKQEIGTLIKYGVLKGAARESLEGK